ncbi:thermonuclease family protein [Moorellaceae bacterium AZ2]
MQVTKVVDGDTVEVRFGDGRQEKLRLIGVDTPESTIQQEPYGKEASSFTRSKLLGRTVYLEKDVSERDKYGRLLRYVWLEKPGSLTKSEIRNKMFNAILLLNGYAQVATYPPDVKYVDYFLVSVKYNPLFALT